MRNANGINLSVDDRKIKPSMTRWIYISTNLKLDL